MKKYLLALVILLSLHVSLYGINNSAPITPILSYLLSSDDIIYDRVVSVNSIEALENAVTNADVSSKIFVEDGSYTSDDITLKNNSAKVYIVAKNINKAIIQRAMIISGNDITLEGFLFNGTAGRVEIKGSNNRVTRCTISNSNASKWLVVKTEAYHVEIDHCLFENKTNNTTETKEYSNQILQVNASETDTKAHMHKIHHNHFRNIPHGIYGNRYETIQLYTVTNDTLPIGPDQHNEVSNNLFENCNGEAEVISVKSNGNLITNNTIVDSQGQIVLRQGSNSTISNNLIIVNGTDEISSGIRIQGKNQKLINNLLLGPMKTGISLHDGQSNYKRVDNFSISDNIIDGARYAIRIGIGSEEIREPIENGTFRNNLLNATEKSIKYDGTQLPINISWDNNFNTGSSSDLENISFQSLNRDSIEKKIKAQNLKRLSEQMVGPFAY